ncbi:hypothetical protein LJC27_02495 [Christensenellaceae bacterium OttesenSCG-928-M15]|nr:hypothetical protein [Christensenellaceae bacterium OttesenSCG-928-M15]
MSKIYLEVHVPGNAKTYDFAADSVMSVRRVKKDMIAAITAVENRELFAKPEEVLFCSANLEGLLQDSEILGEIGVKSGDKIILL